MNILREVRRVKQKSLSTRIILLSGFCVIFILTTYAWFSTQKEVQLGGLEGDVTSWDVSYFVKAEEDEEESEMLDQTVTFTINDLYPGMPIRTDTVNIYNVGTSSTNITYELLSVKVFGQEMLKEDATGNQILEVHKKDENGQDVVEEIPIQTVETATETKTIIFSGDTNYPFNISYTYDKDYLNGKYDEEEPANTPNAHATFKLFVNWTYQGDDIDGTAESEEELLAKDERDTYFGKEAYEYYQNAANDTTKAVEIKVRITSRFIHPSLES